MGLAPYMSLAGAMVIVGSSVAAGKIMIQELPVYLASALRFAVALVVLVPLLLRFEVGFPKLSRRSWAALALQGLCGSFLFTVFTLTGLRFGSAADAGIVTSATPACMGLLSWIFLRERPKPKMIAAIVLSAAGIAAINAGPKLASGFADRTLANLLFLAAVVVESVFLLLRKAVAEKLSALCAATVVSCFGLIYFLPAALIQAAGFDFSRVGAASWLAVAYAGLFVTVAAYLLWFAGIVRVRAQAAGIMTGVMPVAALGFAAWWLGEVPDARQIAGCLLVLAAILAVSLRGETRLRRRVNVNAADDVGAGGAGGDTAANHTRGV